MFTSFFFLVVDTIWLLFYLFNSIEDNEIVNQFMTNNKKRIKDTIKMIFIEIILSPFIYCSKESLQNICSVKWKNVKIKNFNVNQENSSSVICKKVKIKIRFFFKTMKIFISFLFSQNKNLKQSLTHKME